MTICLWRWMEHLTIDYWSNCSCAALSNDILFENRPCNSEDRRESNSSTTAGRGRMKLVYLNVKFKTTHDSPVRLVSECHETGSSIRQSVKFFYYSPIIISHAWLPSDHSITRHHTSAHQTPWSLTLSHRARREQLLRTGVAGRAAGFAWGHLGRGAGRKRARQRRRSAR